MAANDCRTVGNALGITVADDCCTSGANGLVQCANGRVTTLTAACTSSSAWANKAFPYQIGQLAGLNSLSFVNCGLTGTLPNIWGNFYLQELHLEGNKLGGTLPASFGQMIYMNYLYIQGNSFMGALPAGMANWNKITTAQIDGNCFTGTSPNTLIPLGTQRTGCTAPTAGGLGPGGANAPQLPVKTTASRPPAPPGATADPNNPAATQDANAPDPNASSTDGTDPNQPLATAPIVSGIAPPTGKVVQQNSIPGAVPPPTSTSTSSSSPSFTSNVPLIAGVAGGAAALLLIIGSVIFFVRRKSQDRRKGDLDMYADDDGYYRRGDDNEAGRYNEKARMNGVSSRNGGGRPEKANESREKASPSPRYGDRRDNNGDRRDGERREDRGRRDNNDSYEMAEKKRGAAGAANTARSPATRDRDRERDIRSPSNKDMRSPARQPDVSASKKKGPASRDDSRSRPRDLSPDSRGGSFDSDDSFDDRRRGGNTNNNKGRDQSRSRRDDRDYDRRGDAASGGRRNDDRRNKY